MTKRTYKINGKKYDVEILKQENNHVEAEVNGIRYEVEIENNEKSQAPKPSPSEKKSNDTAAPKQQPQAAPQKSNAEGIKAPLPGMIVAVNCKSGDVVKKGQPLLTLEAMKMENIIQSDRDGQIKAVDARVGQAVMEGDVLVTFAE